MLDWGVSCGVGSVGSRGNDGRDTLKLSAREACSRVGGIRLRTGASDGRVEGSLAKEGRKEPLMEVPRGDGEPAIDPESEPSMLVGVIGSKSISSNSGVSLGITVRQVWPSPGMIPAPGVYFNTISVHRWKVASGM